MRAVRLVEVTWGWVELPAESGPDLLWWSWVELEEVEFLRRRAQARTL